MKIRTRLFTADAGNPILRLEDEDSLAIRRVLRLSAGESIVCFNGDGINYHYQIESFSKKSIEMVLNYSRENLIDKFPETHVFIALTKGKTKDRIVKDLPPLGVTNIVFFSADRSVCRWDKNQKEHVKKIAIESCRQCGRSTIPDIEIREETLEELCRNHDTFPEQTFLFWEQCQEPNPPSVDKPEKSMAMIFGPEGGFTQAEISAAQKNNLRICSLGRCILRSELAVIVGVTLVQAQRGIFLY